MAGWLRPTGLGERRALAIRSVGASGRLYRAGSRADSSSSSTTLMGEPICLSSRFVKRLEAHPLVAR